MDAVAGAAGSPCPATVQAVHQVRQPRAL